MIIDINKNRELVRICIEEGEGYLKALPYGSRVFCAGLPSGVAKGSDTVCCLWSINKLMIMETNS